MTEQTAAPPIDKDACLARLQELTGKRWLDLCHGRSTEFVSFGAPVRHRVLLRSNGAWGWSHETDIGRHASGKYNVSASVGGTSATMEDAALAAIGFVPNPPIIVAGQIWYQDGDTSKHRITLVDGLEITISPAGDRLYWRRRWLPLDLLGRALRGASVSCSSMHDLSGFAPTFDDAAVAAVAAPERLRAALRGWLAEGESKPRELPAGAAADFRLRALESPEVDAHLHGALGMGCADPLVLADYLEAVAAQLRADIDGEG